MEKREVAQHGSMAVRRVVQAFGRTLIVAGATAVAGVLLMAIGGSLLSLANGENPRAILAFLWFWLPALLLAPFVVVTAAIPTMALPLMAILRLLDLESTRAYAIWGAVAGLGLSPLLNLGSDPLPPGPISFACIAYGALAACLFYRLFRVAVGSDGDPI